MYKIIKCDQFPLSDKKISSYNTLCNILLAFPMWIPGSRIDPRNILPVARGGVEGRGDKIDFERLHYIFCYCLL